MDTDIPKVPVEGMAPPADISAKNQAPLVEKKSPLWQIVASVVVVGLIGSGLFYYTMKREVHTPGETTDVTVRLGWVHQAQFAGMYVAKEKGYYDEVGLAVELLPLDSNINQTEELASGGVDFSIMEAHQMLAGIGEGSPFTAVGVVYKTNPHALAARKDSGIEKPSDFSGKVIGLAGGEGEGDSLFRIFVNQLEGSDDVTFIELGFDSVDDFVNNRADVIDVYRTDQPYLAEQRGIPLNIIALDAYGFSTYGDVIVASNAFIEESPDVVRRFVTATLRGWKDVLAHPEDAVQTSFAYAGGNYADEEYQRHIVTKSLPLIRGQEGRIGEMDLVSWTLLYEAMQKAGTLQRPFTVRDVYTNQFIQ